MTPQDTAAILLLTGIPLLAAAALWQLYVMLSETHTLNRFQNSPKMLWIALTLFFSFSLSDYCFCPNARKKGIVFLLLGTAGIILYGTGIWYKTRIQAA